MESQLKGATLISLERPRGKGANPTHLSVRFLSATEFVNQYAENLQRGGIFVRNADSLAPLEEVTIDLQLPGFKWFRLKGRVTHVVDPITADRNGSPVGAGVELINPPEKFKLALHDYLGRLGARSDKLVLVGDCDCIAMLESAGYWARETSGPSFLADVAKFQGEIRAVVVDVKNYGAFQELLSSAGGKAPFIIYNRASAHTVLSDLDALLPGTH